MTDPRYEAYSIWGDPPADIKPPLSGTVRADVAIIGGGFTGLAAARTLRAQGKHVVLLEAEFCGAGASSRNTGHLTPTVGRDISYCLKTFGKEKGVALARFSDQAVHHVENLISDLGIKCDYEPVGNFIAGVHPSQRLQLEQAAAVANDAGVKMTFIGEEEMRQYGLPSRFPFAIKEDVGGILNPAKLASALRRAALDEGVEIYETSPVISVEETAPAYVRTGTGAIIANQVMLATNAYTVPSLNRMRNRLFPVRVSQFRTEPLSEEQLDRLGWRSRAGIYTAHQSLENFRLTADNRITGGSKWIQYAYGSKLASGDQPDTFANYEKLLPVRFPELGDIKIDRFWGGWICLTWDFLPFCGITGPQKNIHYSLGYNGHGIAHANRMGHLVALEMCGQPQSELRLFDRRVLPLPPEPFRWLAVKALLLQTMMPDKKVDKDLDRMQDQ